MTHHQFLLDGKPHKEYNAYIGTELDDLDKRAELEGWSKERVNKELLELQHGTRYTLNNKCPKD